MVFYLVGILIVSILIIVTKTNKLYKSDIDLLMVCIIPIFITGIMIFCFEEVWWARYFPQIYFIVLFAILLLDNEENKFWICAKYVFIAIVLVNNFITFGNSVYRAYNTNIEYNKEYLDFENALFEEGSTLEVYAKSFHGAKYNIIDKYGKKYNIVFRNVYPNNVGEMKTFLNGNIEWRCVK